MTTVLVLGNSHVGCLRDAWGAGRERWPGLDLRFFAAQGEHLLDTRLEGTRLRAASEAAAEPLRRLNGADAVDLGAADVVAIVGCGLSKANATRIWTDMRWLALPSVAADPDGLPPRVPLVSRDTARVAHQAQVEETLALRLLPHLGEAVAGRARVAGGPALSERVRERSGEEKGALMAALVAAGDGDAVAALHEEAARRAVEAAGGLYVPQPAETLLGGFLTRREFMDGAFRLSERPGVPQPGDDLAHANARYGALLIDAIVAAAR